METLIANPAFRTYALCSAILGLLIGLSSGPFVTCLLSVGDLLLHLGRWGLYCRSPQWAACPKHATDPVPRRR
jgi:hypothetical protein